MNGKIDWDVFAYKFRGNPQAAFETLAYHMFCRKYHITEGLPAFYNQKHIETDPYRCDDGTVVGFQAKYYNSSSISVAQKKELIEAIEGVAATYGGLNLLCFYISRPFTQSSSKGETKTEMQKSIEEKAEKLRIKIEWVLPSNFEKILNEPENADLWKYFFCLEPSKTETIPKCLTDYVPIGPEIGLIGRDKIVDELRAMLDAERCVALVRGLGGIGKTAVMHKVCDRILTDGNEENHVAWITCGESMEDDLLALCDAFGIPRESGRKEAFSTVLRAIKSIEGKLYLFLDDLSRDSVRKDLERLNALRPNVHVMITSRREIKGIPYIILNELNENSAIDMFYGYYERDKERKYLSDVIGIIDSETVKRHTLLVELLSKAANRSFDTLDVFHRELERKGFFEVSKSKLSTAHDENLTIEESVIKLYGISNLSAEQKRIMSLFTIFTPEKMIYGKVVEWAGFDENDVEKLVKLGWLVRIEDGYIIHQIVRDSIARQVGESLRFEEYGNLLRKVADTNNYMPWTLKYTKVRERLVLAEDVARYVEKTTGRMIKAEKWSKEDDDFLKTCSNLFHNMAGVYYEKKDYSKALEHYRKALEIREQIYGSTSMCTSETYRGIARVYHAQEDFEKGREYDIKALELGKRSNAMDDLFKIDKATMSKYWALRERKKGAYKKADYSDLLMLYMNTLKHKERVLGSDDPSILDDCNNVARVYRKQGDYAKALEYYRRALAICEEFFGSDHIETLKTYNNIASLYRQQRDYKKALEYYEKSLKIRERVLGRDHSDTAATYSNIADMYYAQGNNAKALEYYEKALEIKERVLGSGHPSTATTYNNMAGVYSAQGDYAKALEYYEKGLEIRERVLVRGHPDTAATYNKIAYVYTALRDYTKALEYLEKALKTNERVLGSAHPNTVKTYINMAFVYRALGNYARALEYYEKALEIKERVLGSGHPSTATTYNNMAGVYRAQGDYAKALEYYEKALEILEKALGIDHPNTATTYNNMALVYSAQGDYAKALEYYEKALTVLLDKLGESHPYTRSAQESVMIMKILIEHELSEDQFWEIVNNSSTETHT